MERKRHAIARLDFIVNDKDKANGDAPELGQDVLRKQWKALMKFTHYFRP